MPMGRAPLSDFQEDDEGDTEPSQTEEEALFADSFMAADDDE